jgi:hypothetical protein
MSNCTSTLSTKAQDFIKKEFSEHIIIKAYESLPIYGDSLYANDSHYLLVITHDTNNTYGYLSYLMSDYEDFFDVEPEYKSSAILVTLSENIYGDAQNYLSLITVLAKKLEPHFEGDTNVQNIIIQTGKIGYPNILNLVEKCVYDFEGRHYTYNDVKDLIGYVEK